MNLVLGIDLRSTRHSGRGFRHALTVWFALLGLVVQLTAAGACTMGVRAGIDGATGPFPICHAHTVADEGTPPGDHPSPSHHDQCPFCSMHCHTAMALPQAVGAPMPVPVAAIEPQQTPLVRSPAPRCHAGVSPRGPPRLS